MYTVELQRTDGSWRSEGEFPTFVDALRFAPLLDGRVRIVSPDGTVRVDRIGPTPIHAY